MKYEGNYWQSHGLFLKYAIVFKQLMVMMDYIRCKLRIQSILHSIKPSFHRLQLLVNIYEEFAGMAWSVISVTFASAVHVTNWPSSCSRGVFL